MGSVNNMDDGGSQAGGQAGGQCAADVPMVQPTGEGSALAVPYYIVHPGAVRAQRHATAQYIVRYVEQTFDLKNHKATSEEEWTDGKEEKKKEKKKTKDIDATAVAMLEDLMEIEGNNQLRDAIKRLRQKETKEGDGSDSVPFIEATVEFTMRPKKKKWKTVNNVVKTTVRTGSTTKTA